MMNVAISSVRACVCVMDRYTGTINYVTVPMKRDLNAGIFESVFIVESDRASFKLQNDTKIDLLVASNPGGLKYVF